MHHRTAGQRALLLALTFAAVSFPALAQVYRWTDDQGITHFSQTPPVEAANRERVETLAPPKSSEAEAWQELNSQVKEMQDREDILKENALAEKEQQDRERNCATAKRTISQLDNEEPLRIRGADGTRRKLTDTERAAHLEKARLMEERYCEE
ncbi:MAG: DUF4124 domain-containing protein [Gammaproteobacteria bacterium]|nr:DUF4124 domain-containing protein [Gammaproteobacteria bacterium]